MEHTGSKPSKLKWPQREDIYETPVEDILVANIPEPIPCGTRNRISFDIPAAVREHIIATCQAGGAHS